MFMKKEPDVKKINMVGSHLLFVLQNSFFLIENDNNIAVIDDCIKSYVGEDSYRRFIDKHKKLEKPLKNGNESTPYYASNLIPPEPDIYPIDVEVAQENYPNLLLDVVTLEVQYFFSVAVMLMINKHFKNKTQHFLPFFIQLFGTYAGWSKIGTDKAWKQSEERYHDYAEALELDSIVAGGLAAKNIFNITSNINVTQRLTDYFTSCVLDYEGIFKNL